MPDLRHLRALLERLGEGLIEREQPLRLCLLAALAGENALLLGPPGTAKSLLARRVALAFGEAELFQYLLTRFTTPDELFGPVSIQALREEDSFRRKTAGYMPTAEVVFLDEIFKASSAILNSLLTLINERVFFNGASAEPAPLLALLAASNELPQDQGLAALYDRFALRLMVDPISSEQGFLRMLSADGAAAELTVPEDLRLSAAQLADLRARAREVRLSEATQTALLELRRGLERLAQEHDAPERFYVSDRRWRQALRVLRTSAALHGRDAVDELDCALLPHFLWNLPEDLERAQRLTEEALEACALQVDADLPGLAAAWADLLGELALTPGVAQPVREGFEARTPAGAVRLSAGELSALRRNDPEVVLRSGLVFDIARGTPHVIRRGPSGGLQTTYREEAHSLEQVAAALSAYAGRVGAMVIEDVEVELRERFAAGCLFELGGQPQALRERWLERLTQHLDRIAEAKVVTQRRARRFNERADHHLFVEAAQVSVLRKGLARASLELDEQREKALALQGAIEAGGRYGTSDLRYDELPRG